MACTKGRIAPTSITKLRLFADSGGYCQRPRCLTPLFRDIDGATIHIAEMAHVISAANDGPRANTALTDEQRAAYENLILLCPTCHTVIDKAEQSFPEALVLEWKATHKKVIAEAFGVRQFDSREEVRSAIAPLLRENNTIFQRYGPTTEEQFNPESNVPVQWIRKVRAQILPNNRKILSIAEKNSKYLSEEELTILDLFRQHVVDFEAKHIEAVEESGIRFPVEMSTLFS